MFSKKGKRKIQCKYWTILDFVKCEFSGAVNCDFSGRLSVCTNLPADFPGDYIVIASSHLSLAPWADSQHRLSVTSASHSKVVTVV